MEIHIAAGAPTRLQYADDFRAFKVVAVGLSQADLDQRFSELGVPTEDFCHVFVDLDCLRALAGDRAKDAKWLAGLAAMTEFAERSGWMEAGRVRAHVELVQA